MRAVDQKPEYHLEWPNTGFIRENILKVIHRGIIIASYLETELCRFVVQLLESVAVV